MEDTGNDSKKETRTMELDFKPTRIWIKEHKTRPKECLHPDIPCYNILDHFNQHGHGFCAGISLDEADGDLDIIRFCDRTYDPETGDAVCASRQWHPNEAQLVSTYLSIAVINAWGLLPEYRRQLGEMGRRRTRQIHDRSAK